MAKSMSDVCKRAVVPTACFNKDCKCRIKIPSKDGSKIDSGAI